MDPCDFPDRKNPITKKGCRQSMTNMNLQEIGNNESLNNLPDDLLIQFYFFGLSIIGIYILYKFMNKNE